MAGFVAGDNGGPAGGGKSLQRPKPHDRRKEGQCEPGHLGGETPGQCPYW